MEYLFDTKKQYIYYSEINLYTTKVFSQKKLEAVYIFLKKRVIVHIFNFKYVYYYTYLTLKNGIQIGPFGFEPKFVSFED